MGVQAIARRGVLAGVAGSIALLSGVRPSEAAFGEAARVSKILIQCLCYLCGFLSKFVVVLLNCKPGTFVWTCAEHDRDCSRCLAPRRPTPQVSNH